MMIELVIVQCGKAIYIYIRNLYNVLYYGIYYYFMISVLLVNTDELAYLIRFYYILSNMYKC